MEIVLSLLLFIIIYDHSWALICEGIYWQNVVCFKNVFTSVTGHLFQWTRYYKVSYIRYIESCVSGFLTIKRNKNS